MSLYLTADGGGTKLHVLAFDENLKPVGFGCSGGTNINFIKREQAERHIREAFSAALSGNGNCDALYATIVGDARMVTQTVGAEATIGRTRFYSEMEAYLLAGALTNHAVLALAGTGSGAGYIRGEEIVCYCGGYGSEVGDDGSGWWIGSQGVNAVIRAEEGWGEKTALSALLWKYLEISDLRGLIRAVYGNPRGSRAVAAGFCPMVGSAADAGDPVAVGIVREAGRLMAAQTEAALRMGKPSEDIPVVCCGGAWNCSPLFYESFCERLREAGVAHPVQRACFSPVLHGAVAYLLEQGENPARYLPELQRLQDCLR